MSKDVVIIGAGGHAKSIANVIYKAGDNVKGFLDDNIEAGTVIIKEKKCEVLGSIINALHLQEKYHNIEFIIGIGENFKRREIAEQYEKNLNFYTAIDPSSQIALDVEIGKGSVVLANTCINTATKIGKHCIINTAAIIEHDNIIGDYVHISPHCTLCGNVKVGEGTWIGAGSIVIPGVKIGKWSVLGAGSVVTKDIPDGVLAVGNRCKIIKQI